MISRSGAKSLTSSDVEPRCRARNRRWRKSHHNKNLMAPCTFGCKQLVKTIWVLTGDGSPQSIFGIQIAIRVCACWNRTTFRTLRCSLRIKSVGLSNRSDAFVFALCRLTCWSTRDQNSRIRLCSLIVPDQGQGRRRRKRCHRVPARKIRPARRSLRRRRRRWGRCLARSPTRD